MRVRVRESERQGEMERERKRRRGRGKEREEEGEGKREKGKGRKKEHSQLRLLDKLEFETLEGEREMQRQGGKKVRDNAERLEALSHLQILEGKVKGKC